MLVISPHLDDAVFSCADLIGEQERCVIATICAGVPPADTPPSHFDHMVGFTSAAEAVRTRRAEDAAAAVVLGAELVHYPCLDDVYDRGGEREALITQAVTHAVASLATPGETILGPLGLRHPDHILTAAAFRAVAKGEVWAYAELPYRILWPEFLDPAIAAAGCGVGDTFADHASPLKHRALRCYGSQIIGMDTRALLMPERFHRLSGERKRP